MKTREGILALMPKGSVGIEVGVWKGDFSQRILDYVDPHILVLVDPWQYNPEYGDSWYGNKKMDQNAMDGIFNSVVDRFSSDGRVSIHRGVVDHGIVADEMADWIYIDGDHTYEGVMNDIKHSWDLLAKGGTMIFDDYGEAGWWFDGVKLAVNEFAVENGLKVCEVDGNAIIRKPV